MKNAIWIILTIFSTQLYSMNFLSGNSFDIQNEINKAQSQKGKNNQKFSYKDLVEFLKNSDDPQQTMILGILYSKGSDKTDDFGEKMEKDIVKSEKYLRLSASKGNYLALAMLGGLVLYNEDMRRLDPDLNQTLIDLQTAYDNGEVEAGVLLATTLFEKKQWKKGLQVLIDASNKGDSVAQLQLALIFKQGLKDGREKESKNWIVKPKEEVALYYLNKACSNEKKNKKVKEFCFNKKNITIERK